MSNVELTAGRPSEISNASALATVVASRLWLPPDLRVSRGFLQVSGNNGQEQNVDVNLP